MRSNVTRARILTLANDDASCSPARVRIVTASFLACPEAAWYALRVRVSRGHSGRGAAW